jgi:hypothetical protein
LPCRKPEGQHRASGKEQRNRHRQKQDAHSPTPHPPSRLPWEVAIATGHCRHGLEGQ